jgi:hypothetical protein
MESTDLSKTSFLGGSRHSIPGPKANPDELVQGPLAETAFFWSMSHLIAGAISVSR